MSKDDESLQAMPKQKRELPEEFMPGKGKRPNKTMRLEDNIKIESPTSVSLECNVQPCLQLKIQTQPVTYSAPSSAHTTPSPSIVDADQQSVTITLKMPNRASMLHVLRCAYNEVTGMMAREQSSAYLKYAKNIEQFIGKLGQFIWNIFARQQSCHLGISIACLNL